jgi:hypothetical protein
LINNRQQSGRRRGRGGQRQNNNGGGGGRGPESGNRIDNRARGNAAQLLEKYKTLARDAQQGGDRVLTEYYLQFADHYFRVLSETRARYEENNPQARRPQGDYAEGEQSFENEDGEDGDEEDDFGFRAPQRAQQAPPQQQQRDQQPRQDRQSRDDRPREDRVREDRPREERPLRDDRAPRDEQRPRQYAEDRPRDDRPREDRPQRQERPRRDYGDERPQRAATTSETREGPEGEASPPRRQSRPRADSEPSRRNGASSHAEVEADTGLDLAVLPPAISAAVSTPVSDDGDAPAPKKRGRPRKEAVPAAE